ncbi:MAG: hypothetical protein ABIK07_22215 [Planctomycetota bacterium]|uniref:hypothetical protein n=1 Tax=uncultured Gimesia sp. TaxID=1678688 RepID=UPI00261CD1A0|nr:hypothetical protein [uncultured Gimesia sp.]
MSTAIVGLPSKREAQQTKFHVSRTYFEIKGYKDEFAEVYIEQGLVLSSLTLFGREL